MALLDHDDELAPHALYLAAHAILETPDVNLLYTDEDQVDEEGQRRAPYFKPDCEARVEEILLVTCEAPTSP